MRGSGIGAGRGVIGVGRAIAAGALLVAALGAMPGTAAQAATCTVAGSASGPLPPAFVPAQVVSGSFSFGPGVGPFTTSVSIAPFDTSLGAFGFATFDLVGSGSYTLPIGALTGCPGGTIGIGLDVGVAFDNGVATTYAAADLAGGSVDVVPGGVSLATGGWSLATPSPEAWLALPVGEVGVTIDPIFSVLDGDGLPLAGESSIDGVLTLTVSYYYAPPGYILGPGGVLIPIGDGGEGGGGGPTPGVEGVPAPGMSAILALGTAGLALLRRHARRRAFA
ncbi:MAG: hypothetical protein JNK67_26125 [Alphaproteobacteria bacterium]|nr:hypothetical protein [Alphaproteobacteria bacterium]